MSQESRTASLAAAFLLIAALTASSQEGAPPPPTSEEVDTLCNFYESVGHDSRLFRAIADGDLTAAVAAIPAWRDHDSYGPFPGPLTWAILFGDLEMVKTLVGHGVRIDETWSHHNDSSWDIPAVYTALYRGRTEIARFLVEQGAPPIHALMYACSHNDTALFSFALTRVRNVDDRSGAPYATTALFRAAEGGNLEFVKALVAKGANVNASAERPSYWDNQENGPDELWQDDPLAAAVREGHLDVARFLLSKGAKATVSALDAALTRDRMQ